MVELGGGVSRTTSAILGSRIVGYKRPSGRCLQSVHRAFPTQVYTRILHETRLVSSRLAGFALRCFYVHDGERGQCLLPPGRFPPSVAPPAAAFSPILRRRF